MRASYAGRRSRLALLVAFLAMVLGMLLPLGTASASGLPAAQTRVGVSHPAVVHIVGIAEHIAAGQRPVRAPSQLQIVSGHCVAAEDVGLSARGFRPAPGTRVRPDGVPENWRITGTDSRGGTQYSDPSNSGNSVRVMQGNTNSPYANSQTPYVRWQQDGQALDMFGNKLPSAKDSAAHVPLDDFNFIAELFQ